MALFSLRQLLDHAAEDGYGIPAFNITNLEKLQGVMQVAAVTSSPVILQASQSAESTAMMTCSSGSVFLLRSTAALGIPICVHQDHGSSVALCLAAIDLGFLP